MNRSDVEAASRERRSLSYADSYAANKLTGGNFFLYINRSLSRPPHNLCLFPVSFYCNLADSDVNHALYIATSASSVKQSRPSRQPPSLSADPATDFRRLAQIMLSAAAFESTPEIDAETH